MNQKDASEWIKPILGGVIGGVIVAATLLLLRPKPVTPTWTLSPTPTTMPALELEDLNRFVVSPPATSPATGPSEPDPLGMIIDDINVNDVPLSEVIGWLRQKTGANMVVNWHAIEAARVPLDQKVSLQLRNVPASTVLEMLLGEVVQTDIRYRCDDGIVYVSTVDNLSRGGVTRIYDVRDLLVAAARLDLSLGIAARPVQPPVVGSSGPPLQIASSDLGNAAADALAEMIIDTIEPSSWNANGGITGSLHYFGGRLIVMQTPENQTKVQQLLTMLRTNRGEFKWRR